LLIAQFSLHFGIKNARIRHVMSVSSAGATKSKPSACLKMRKQQPNSTPPSPRAVRGEEAGKPGLRSHDSRGMSPPSESRIPLLQRNHEDILIGVALLVVTLAAYWSVYRLGFLNYDDAEYVTDNVRVQMGLTRGNVAWGCRTFFF